MSKQYQKHVLHDEAVAAVRSGHTVVEVARNAHVSESTVRRWVKIDDAAKRKRRAKPEPVAAPESPPETIPPPPLDVSSVGILETMQRMLENNLRVAENAKDDGNHTVAQRALRDAANLSNQIMRHEKEQRDAGDDLRISRSEIDDARDRVRELIKTLASRPLLCAGCARELSIEWSGLDASELNREEKGS